MTTFKLSPQQAIKELIASKKYAQRKTLEDYRQTITAYLEVVLYGQQVKELDDLLMEMVGKTGMEMASQEIGQLLIKTLRNVVMDKQKAEIIGDIWTAAKAVAKVDTPKNRNIWQEVRRKAEKIDYAWALKTCNDIYLEVLNQLEEPEQ